MLSLELTKAVYSFAVVGWFHKTRNLNRRNIVFFRDGAGIVKPPSARITGFSVSRPYAVAERSLGSGRNNTQVYLHPDLHVDGY